MNLTLKAACIAAYLLAAASLAGWLPPDAMPRVVWVAAGLLLIHAVELVFAFKHVRRYPGPLALSVLLTLLFGLLHWKPLADGQALAKPLASRGEG